MPLAVVDLLLFLHAAARLRIAPVQGLKQPVNMQPGIRQGDRGSPLLYAPFLESLLRAKRHRLRPPGEAERGHVQAYIDNLLVVAHTLQDLAEGVQAVDTSE